MDLGWVAGSSTGEAEEAVQVRLLGFQWPSGSFAPAGDVSVRGRAGAGPRSLSL